MKWFMKQRNETKIFYICAIFTFLCALLSMYNVYEYISKLVQANQLVISQQFLKVVNTYVEACSPYIFYTLALVGIGYIISMGNTDMQIEKVEEKTDNDSLSDDELDNFLETMETEQ